MRIGGAFSMLVFAVKQTWNRANDRMCIVRSHDGINSDAWPYLGWPGKPHADDWRSPFFIRYDKHNSGALRMLYTCQPRDTRAVDGLDFAPRRRFVWVN